MCFSDTVVYYVYKKATRACVLEYVTLSRLMWTEDKK